MRKVKRKKSIHKELYLVWFLLIAFSFLSTPMGCANPDYGKRGLISEVSFSPDSKKILFGRKTLELPHMLYTYDLGTGVLVAYASPPAEQWDQAQYSLDGKHIVFVTTPLELERYDSGEEQTVPVWNDSQIAIMDADGNNVRKITNTPGHKQDPSFSHSGKKIIFTRRYLWVPYYRGYSGPSYAYELDLETGRETRLARFGFIGMSRPYYFPDDKRFIFWGHYLMSIPENPDIRTQRDDFLKVEKLREELQSKYSDNDIYVMQKNEKELKPYLVIYKFGKKYEKYFPGAEYSTSPSLSADGSVLVFEAQGYKPDGSGDAGHLYQYSPDGNHRDIAQIPYTTSGVAMSPNGEMAAVVASVPRTIVIYQVKDGTSREIALPEQPSRIIITKAAPEEEKKQPVIDTRHSVFSANEFVSPTLGAKFVMIPEGKFTMGSHWSEVGRYDNETQHGVTISRPFYMQTTVVTQGQWKRVMGKNPSYFKKCGDDCPVEQVSWADVHKFIDKLNNMEGTDKYRLPTEAEWEYAARAGTTTPFYTGNCLSTDQANYDGYHPLSGCPKGEFRRKTVPVGSFSPNAWGLYDMYGNVYQWNQDIYVDYPSTSVTDPVGASSDGNHVVRGGSWREHAWNCRAASRYSAHEEGDRALGFRLVTTP